MSSFIRFRSRAFAAKRFRLSIELEVFKQSALSLVDPRDDGNPPLVELVVEFDADDEVDDDDELLDEDVKLANELVDLAMFS